jgi:hypothetical protein
MQLSLNENRKRACILYMLFPSFFRHKFRSLTHKYPHMNPTILTNLLLSFIQPLTAPKAKKTSIVRKISIKLETVLSMSNNHVGDDWTHFLSIQKQVIKKGETVIFTLHKRAPMLIEAHSVEDDKDYPDAGENSIEFIYSDLIDIERNRFEMDVVVVENGGQYAGNTATWKFLFVLQSVKD